MDIATLDNLARNLCAEYEAEHGHIGGNDLRVIAEQAIREANGPVTVARLHEIVAEAREEHAAEQAAERAPARKGADA